MCKAFNISRSSYYAWTSRKVKPTKSELIKDELIYQYKKSKQTYGAPRLTKKLQKEGYEISPSTVGRIMSSAGIYARKKRRYVHTTDSSHGYKVYPNILNRDFSADKINQKWVSDITYIATKKGWSYLTVILDLADRMVVGWHLSNTLSSKNTVVAAMKIALERRTIKTPLVFHSDRGIQYCSSEFRSTYKREGRIQQSMSRKGNCWDNAVAESFFKTLKVEWVSKHKYDNADQARRSIFDYIERWYNTQRMHSSLDYLSPLQKHKLIINNNAA